MESPVLHTFALGTPPWQTFDPFLFCVHHNDAYPAGDGSLGPGDATFARRAMGSDFANVDGWNMYHGDTVPGFPQHPHRGFETVTFVRRGFIDHADSLGATARYGAGDTQWLTAGAGIVHAEMFPLLNTDTGNHTELFQLWLNLPRVNKMTAPHFTMLWAEDIPIFSPAEGVEVTVVAGTVEGHTPPSPPPDSWASQPESNVAIWRINLERHATWVLPAAATGGDVTRTLYVYEGSGITVGTHIIATGTGAVVDASQPLDVVAGPDGATVLMLQGSPINEPVAQYGPFVMNDRAGVEQAFADYQRTQFGGWPYADNGPTHGQVAARFARRPDGGLELPPGAQAIG
jgi:quercetin 2,3-dioxygenase